MSKEKEKKPQWVLAANQNLIQAKLDINVIRQAGQADIRRGLETVKGAEQRIQELNYLERVLGQNLSPASWDDEVVRVTGTSLGGSASAFQRDIHHLAELYTGFSEQKETQHRYLTNAINNTGVSSVSMVYMGAQIERRLEAITPAYKPQFDLSQPEQISSRQQVYNELAEILQPLNSKYLYMLKGSEDALHRSGADNLSQAAHSMRDLFQQIIEDLAPTNVVKQQPWFNPTPDAPGEVSRMSRLRHILYGTGIAFDEREIEQLDAAAMSAKNALDLSIARAHSHDPELTPAEVELAIDHARFSLLQVLKRYSSRRDQETA